MEKAIRKALEGGWKPWRTLNFPKIFTIEHVDFRQCCIHDNQGKIVGHIDYNIALLDPAFWQALGKAEEWQKLYPYSESSIIAWQMEWHRFIDALIEGKTPDEFFNDLFK